MDPVETAGAEAGTADGDAALLAALRDGDQSAFGRLYDAWFDRAYDVAVRIGHDPDNAADVAQDAFVAAWRNLDDLEDQQAFGGWLLRITRNRALDHKRKHDRTTPVDDETMTVIETTGSGAGPPGAGPEDRLAAAVDPAQAMEDAELAALVWDAADALGDRDASLLDLHLRHGLSPAEIAEELGVKANAAHQSLHRMRDRLGGAIRARVVWKGGHPACAELGRVLEAAGATRFDSDTASTIRGHAKTCDGCTSRERTHLEPSSLFAAVPIAVAPIALKAKAAAAMEGAGIPMEGSEHATLGADDADAATKRERRRRRLVGALVAVFVLLASIGTVLALTTRSLDPDDQAAPSTTVPPPVTTSPTTTPVASTTPDPAAGPDLGPQSPAPAPPAAPAEEPAPPAIPSIVSFSLSPTAIAPESTPPVIAWSVDPAGSGTAELTGPNLFTTALSGSQAVCPGVITSGICVTPPGGYDYTLHAYDSGGSQVDVRTLTLSVG